MVLDIYKQAAGVLAQKPLKLWGISLLSVFLISVISGLFSVLPGVGLCVGILLGTAMAIIYLRGFRGENIEVLQLFDCCRDWQTAKRVLCGMLWMYMWVFLWSLIPVAGIVFGIIRTYEYRLTPYILMQEPEVKATDAYKVSSARTMGYKSSMFLADFLVFAAFSLAIIIFSGLALIRYIGWIFGIGSTVLIIVAVAILPIFTGLVQAAFYEKIEAARRTPQQTWTAPPIGQ